MQCMRPSKRGVIRYAHYEKQIHYKMDFQHFFFNLKVTSMMKFSIQRAQYLTGFLTGTIFFLFILTVIYLVKLFNSPSNEPFLLYILVNTIDVVIILGLRYANKKGHVKWVAYGFLVLVIISITLGLFVPGLESIHVLYFLPVIAASFVLPLFHPYFLPGYALQVIQWLNFYHRSTTSLSDFFCHDLGCGCDHILNSQRSLMVYTKLNELWKQNRALVENAPGVMYIINLYPKTSWAYISPQVSTLLGYSREEWVNSKSIWKDSIHPEDLPQVKRIERQARRNKKAFSCEYRIKRKDGEYIWVKDDSYFFRNNSGVDQMYGLMTDITPLKRYQNALQESEDRIRTIVNGVRDAIFVENADGEILEVNDRACALYGWSRQEFIGKKVSEIVPAENKVLTEKDLQTEVGSDKLVETINRRKNGDLFPVELSAHIEKLGDRDVMLVVARDITERKKTEEKIQQSLKEKNVLLQELHHRVKNNLQVMSSLLSFQSMSVTDPIAKDSFRVAQSRIRAIASIHEDLYRSPDVSQIHMHSYINQLINNLASLYGLPEGIHLTLDVDDITLDLDNAISCGLIVNELVTNAFKYAFNGNGNGKIKVSLKPSVHSSSQYNLTVEDNGIGVSDEKLSETNKGLGIQLVKTLSSQLNGTATFTSRKGTKVSVDFLSKITESKLTDSQIDF